MTNLDVLGYLDQIPVCTAYEVDGKTITDFPSTPTLMRCKPVYTMLPGWKSDVRGVRDRMGQAARKLQKLHHLYREKELQVPIHMISHRPQARGDAVSLRQGAGGARESAPPAFVCLGKRAETL